MTCRTMQYQRLGHQDEQAQPLGLAYWLRSWKRGVYSCHSAQIKAVGEAGVDATVANTFDTCLRLLTFACGPPRACHGFLTSQVPSQKSPGRKVCSPQHWTSSNHPVVDGDGHNSLGSQVLAVVHGVTSITSQEGTTTNVDQHGQLSILVMLWCPDIEGQILAGVTSASMRVQTSCCIYL